MPSKLKDVLWFSNCKADFFTAYDPPKTLVPAAAMNPTITTDAGAPQAETRAPVPGSTQQDPGASKTASDPTTMVTPAQDPLSSEPKASKDPVAMIPNPIFTVTPAQNPQQSQSKVSMILQHWSLIPSPQRHLRRRHKTYGQKVPTTLDLSL